MLDLPSRLDAAFPARLIAGDLPDCGPTALAPDRLAALLDVMMLNRHLDLLARRSKGQTFYSIGSSGHEVMAIMAEASRLDDLAFLHYRDANFLMTRKSAVAPDAVLEDMLLSFCASADDPVSGGRHKVLGGKSVFVPPQTSTIASHLPKAVGMAHSIGLARKVGHQGDVPNSSVVICSFGDASANHSTAQGAINAAGWAAYQGGAMPIVFVCEDNGLGISVKTPGDWIGDSFRARAGLSYMRGDGSDPASAYAACKAAVDYARQRKRPVFLHLKTVRLMGHAGADIETSYRSAADIDADLARDPLIVMAASVIKSDAMSAKSIAERYAKIRAEIDVAAPKAFARPKLETAAQIMEPIAPAKSAHKPRVKITPVKDTYAKNLTLSRAINIALADIMKSYPQALIFGEDVGAKGGVYGVTKGLQKTYGPRRVWDTLLDEQTILGTAIGAAHNGFLPIPEIQFLAYLHNAEDQIRGEAATLSFFSDSQFTNPMVIRIAGLGYQRGFGGHFHNDNGLAVLRDIPGLIVVCPSHGADAGPILKECARLAHQERRVVIIIEPIALYHTTDLHDGDQNWTHAYDAKAEIAFGEIGRHGTGKDVAILTYGNGYYLSRQAEAQFKAKSRIIDMRWLSPLPWTAIDTQIKDCKSILIVDECRKTGSISEEIMARLTDQGNTKPVSRVTSYDSFIPLGNAAYAVMPSVDDIATAVSALVKSI